MSKLESIIKEGTYKELADYCDQNNIILKEQISDGNYICSIIDKDCDHDNILNCMLSGDDNLQAFVVDSNGEVVDTIVDGDKTDDLLESITSSIEIMNLLPNSSDKKRILNEDKSSEDGSVQSEDDIVASLNDCKLNLKNIADKIKDTSDMTSDIEISSVIVDLASNAYALILDIESAIETYKESIGENEDESEDNSEIEDEAAKVSETRSRVKVMESVSAMLDLHKAGHVSDESYHEYLDLCNKIFS